jgi:hypothetical protein
MSHRLDPEEMVQCPFDPYHKIAAYKLANHILKCRKNHVELDKALEKCPFNALHRFLPKDREQHILECIDKDRVLLNRPRPIDVAPLPPPPPVVSFGTREKRPTSGYDADDWDEG